MAEEKSSFSLPDPNWEPNWGTNALRALFLNLVNHAFHDTLGLPQREVSAYLVDLLAAFAANDTVYRIPNQQGQPLRQVGEMLLEADVALNATSFERERAVHKHIGDFTLFFAGLYPEALRRMRAPGHLDSLIDYVRQGKESYYIVSTFAHGPYAQEACLFRLLSEEFELCQYGLSLVRREWERLAKTPPSF